MIILWGSYGVKWCGIQMNGTTYDAGTMFYLDATTWIGLPSDGFTTDPASANESITVDTNYGTSSKREAIIQLKVVYEGRSLPYSTPATTHNWQTVLIRIA